MSTFSSLQSTKLIQQNKIAFQWDAYCPLVERIPACTAEGGGQGGGVPASGVYLLGGRGVPARGGGYPSM